MGGRESMFRMTACEQAARAHLRLHQNLFEQSEDSPLLPLPRQGSSSEERGNASPVGWP